MLAVCDAFTPTVLEEGYNNLIISGLHGHYLEEV